MKPFPITSFSGEYRFLSNFYPSIVSLDHRQYPTVEHAYQAAKSKLTSYRLTILEQKTPGKAKQLGRTIKIRQDWEEIKFDVMEKLLRRKFEHTIFRKQLLLTQDRELVEGNTWGDCIWGQCPVGKGENNLGKLLMKIRSELQKEMMS